MSVINSIEDIDKELISWRRDFHEFPESGWLEYRTSAKIADLLTSFGYEVHVGKDVCQTDSRMGLPNKDRLKENEKRALAEGANPKWLELMKDGHTGVVGVLKTTKPGPITALRFDIDSLDLIESENRNHLPVSRGFRSAHEGMMHACGHDGHAAIGLGTAKTLMWNKDKLCGEIRLLFQPAEEGCRGAKSMVDKGWLDNVDYFYSGHIAFQSFELGEVVTAVGGFMATTKIDVTYKGTSAHAGDKPETGKNALLAAASASTHLHGISRHSDGNSRVNVGELHSGTSRNIIPNLATMAIETRGETTEINEYMTKEAVRIIESTAKTFDVECNWEIVGKASVAKSDEKLMRRLQPEIEKAKGVKSIIPFRNLNASEDVVYMINEVQRQGGKASFLLFGTPIPAGHHQPLFDFDESVLSVGVNVLTRLVLASAERRV